MKKTICFYFQVHQPFRLRRYRFFDIGDSHEYFDEFNNRSIMKKVANRCYLPMNRLLLDLIGEYGKKFKVSFSITGSAIEQFELYAPEVLDSFRQLADTGCVEFLTETSAHSLAVMKDSNEFRRQVELHRNLIQKYFGQTPTTFRLTELIYDDLIGAQVEKWGYKTILTEGARHILGWKSPNFVYANAINPKLKVLLRNFRLSDDISFRFSDKNWSEFPVTAEKYAAWLNKLLHNEEIVNLFMDYETFGEHQSAASGIFAFMQNLPKHVMSDFEFLTPAEVYDKHQPIASIHVPYPISWADEERDLSAWLGNELQDDAFDTLYSLSDKIEKLADPELTDVWLKLQNSDHFYYMCTKWFSDGSVHKYFNPYSSPYDAYINYMNVLSDFIKLVETRDEADEQSKNDKMNDWLETHKNSRYHLALIEYVFQKHTPEKPAPPKAKTKKSTAAKPANTTKSKPKPTTKEKEKRTSSK